MAEVRYNLGALGIMPSGAVIPFAGSTAPQGYLLCDGREVSRTDYPYLFDAIGTTYGEGDGSTTFNLPNLQDKFVQGAGTNAVGTEMNAGLPNIAGSFYLYTYPGSSGTGSFTKTISNSSASTKLASGGEAPYSQITLNASRSSSVYGNSTTVQPPSVVMNYIIKY